MVSLRLTGTKNWIKEIDEAKLELHQFRDRIIETTIDTVVRYSPEDTGAYNDSHKISRGRVTTGGVSSKDKPKITPGKSRAAARKRLKAQYRALPDKSKVTLSNNAPHANKVEYTGWGQTPAYRPYTKTRSLWKSIIARAKRRKSV